MKTLHEMAVKLQDSIIKQQDDAHNTTNLNVTKYNNLKIRMDTRYAYPHAIIVIGISEAVFNIADGTKTDGGLGPDEKYVRKWLTSSTVIADLKEIYIAMGELIKAEDSNKAISQEGEADEVKKEAPKKKLAFKNLLENAMPLDGMLPEGEEAEEGEELISIDEETHKTPEQASKDDSEPETVDDIKKGLKDYLKSMFRKK